MPRTSAMRVCPGDPWRRTRLEMLREEIDELPGADEVEKAWVPDSTRQSTFSAAKIEGR